MHHSQDYVILIDQQDNEIGSMEKIQAHQQGKLHRAFSIFIFNSKKELLIQKRADNKYHSGGLWSNTCCGHPRPGELTENAAQRRLQEEIGITCQLHYLFPFTYFVKFDNNLIENELDHIFTGITDKTPLINPNEISDFKYMTMAAISNELEKTPTSYTVWFKLIFNQLQKTIYQL